MLKKIFVTGAQGTGKTTLVTNLFHAGTASQTLLDHHLIPSYARMLSKLGYGINEQSDERTQIALAACYYAAFVQNADLISDRSMVDVMAYTILLNKVSATTLDVVEAMLLEAVKLESSIYLFIPIEFPIKREDGRSSDEKFRKRVNDCILSVYESYKIPYFIITGSEQERVKSAIAALKSSS
jgi:predicted ATPase